VRIFKNKAFARFARKAPIADALLWSTAAEIEQGRIDADLGGGIIKQRIARTGAGKSGGFRVLLIRKPGECVFSVHGFAKNERDNIRDDELAALKRLAAELLDYDEGALAQAVAAGALVEVTGSEEEIQ
jgi:hypothetical protein